MRKLIINADDFALTNACSKAIIELFEIGILTSTTMLVTGRDFEQSVQLAKRGKINIGLHLCLTYGQPVAPLAQVNLLTNEHGVFKPISILRNEKVDARQVEIEWRAQIAKLLNSGIKPDHLDSHHYVHECLGQEVFAVAAKLSKELGIPLRQGSQANRRYCQQQGIKTTDSFCRDFYGENVGIKQLQEILSRPWQGTMELMCHPGHVDEHLKQLSSYTYGRQEEFSVLSSSAIAEQIKREAIQLISFSDL